MTNTILEYKHSKKQFLKYNLTFIVKYKLLNKLYKIIGLFKITPSNERNKLTKYIIAI